MKRFVFLIFMLIFAFFWWNVMPPDAVEFTEPLAGSKEKAHSSHHTEKPEPTSRFDFHQFQAGMNVLVYGHPDMTAARDLLRRLRNLGINGVAITFPFFQDHWQAHRLYTSPMDTPSVTELEQLIRMAKTVGFHVMIRPILDEQSLMETGHWRGNIAPRSPKAWFQSYRTLLLPYAELAQQTGVDILNIGTEFSSLEMPYSHEWIRLIHDIREVYDGKLIYSFNWDRMADIHAVPFVPWLDYIGLDAYFPLDVPDDANVSMLQEAWKRWTVRMNRLSGKPVVITEAGMIPVSGAFRTPYAWSLPDRKLDWAAQARYYEATFYAWQPLTRGIYWWCVPLTADDPDVVGYSPLGSPTETVIQRLFAHPTILSSKPGLRMEPSGGQRK